MGLPLYNNSNEINNDVDILHKVLNINEDNNDGVNINRFRLRFRLGFSLGLGLSFLLSYSISETSISQRDDTNGR